MNNIELFLFSRDVSFIKSTLNSGISAYIIDWENQNKYQRQQNYDTEINHDTVNDLANLAQHFPDNRIICRINQFGKHTRTEVKKAINAGATDILLPMVKKTSEVEKFLHCIDGKTKAGILVETQEACDIAADLASLPLDMVYMGLNDLAISYKVNNIFMPLVNGLAMKVREKFADIPFGLGGVTVVNKGCPIPSKYLMSELVRHQCHFSFLRRSFKNDILNRDLIKEINLIQTEWKCLSSCSVEEIEHNHQQFLKYYHLCSNKK